MSYTKYKLIDEIDNIEVYALEYAVINIDYHDNAKFYDENNEQLDWQTIEYLSFINSSGELIQTPIICKGVKK